MINIQNMPDVVNIINAALNDGKTVEIKNESRQKDRPNIVVVEINRIVKTKKPQSKENGKKCVP